MWLVRNFDLTTLKTPQGRAQFGKAMELLANNAPAAKRAKRPISQVGKRQQDACRTQIRDVLVYINEDLDQVFDLLVQRSKLKSEIEDFSKHDQLKMYMLLEMTNERWEKMRRINKLDPRLLRLSVDHQEAQEGAARGAQVRPGIRE